MSFDAYIAELQCVWLPNWEAALKAHILSVQQSKVASQDWVISIQVSQSNYLLHYFPAHRTQTRELSTSFIRMALYPQSPTSVPRAPMPLISLDNAPLPRIHPCVLQEPQTQHILPPGAHRRLYAPPRSLNQ